jgi:hypothetical protein
MKNNAITIVIPSSEINSPEPIIIIANKRKNMAFFQPPTGGNLGAEGTSEYCSVFDSSAIDSKGIVAAAPTSSIIKKLLRYSFNVIILRFIKSLID